MTFPCLSNIFVTLRNSICSWSVNSGKSGVTAVTNSNFVGWNRFPLNESARKIFKVNGGFSKVMNLVNQDISAERSKSNSENVSKERNSSSEDGKLKNKIYNTKNKFIFI